MCCLCVCVWLVHVHVKVQVPAAEFACEHQGENGGEARQEILPRLLLQTLSFSQAVAAKRGRGPLAARQQVRHRIKSANGESRVCVCARLYIATDGPDCFITP